MTYDDLYDTIQAYTENQFPVVYLASGGTVSATTQIDTFITQAEQRIYNSVQFPSLRKNVTGQTGAYNAVSNPRAMYLSCPIDFLSTFSLAVVTADGQEFLLNKDVNFIRQAYPKATDTGVPKYYALFGPTTTNSLTPAITNELSFILGPTPDVVYDVELHYYYYPVSITDTDNNPTGRTWLGDNFDTVLLYGSLVEAYTFMKGDADMLALYNQKYMEALALAKRLGDGLERSDAYRSGQYREAPLPQNNGVR
jgi:hypothetical protein